MKKNNASRNAGFSLVELLVVLAIFVIIIMTAGALFISIIDRQRNILADQEMTSQASFAVEYMSRSLRNIAEDTLGNCTGTVGGIYALTHYDGNSQAYRGVIFLTQDNVCQEFYIDEYGWLKESKNGSGPQNIFSDKFTINYLRFAINGAKSINIAKKTDTLWPRITFVLSLKKVADQVAFSRAPLFKFNYASAQFQGIPTCGDGVCDPGESVYCSNRCPLADDCNACIAPPQAPTGLLCASGACIMSPNGYDNCTLGSSCSSAPTPPSTPTGLSCVNQVCITNPSGTDTCNPGFACGSTPNPPTPPTGTGLSCVNNTCIADSLGVDTCNLGSSCVSAPEPPLQNVSPTDMIIQVTVSRSSF